MCSLAIFIILTLFPSYVFGADFKPIELQHTYNHDKYKTQPRDLFKEFRAYVTSFDSEDDDNGDGKSDILGIPHWVAYEIKIFEGSLGKGPKRPSTWITDKDLAKKKIAPKDGTYKYSKAFRSNHPNWYDRGHLCMKQHAWRLGPNADWNTHTVLNAVPQRHNFNAGIWLDMENKTAAWADKFGNVWIIAGPIFNNFIPRKWLGEKLKGEVLIGIPDSIFKIVIKDSGDPNRPDVLAFIYPQKGPHHKKKPFNHEDYLTSVDRIEDLTNINFFTTLSDSDQNAIEGVTQIELWD